MAALSVVGAVGLHRADIDRCASWASHRGTHRRLCLCCCCIGSSLHPSFSSRFVKAFGAAAAATCDAPGSLTHCTHATDRYADRTPPPPPTSSSTRYRRPPSSFTSSAPARPSFPPAPLRPNLIIKCEARNASSLLCFRRLQRNKDFATMGTKERGYRGRAS